MTFLWMLPGNLPLRLRRRRNRPQRGGGIPDDGGGKAAGGKDNAEEAGEYAERQARMRRLSDERSVAEEAESGLRVEREALGRLAAERDARQDTIDKLQVCQGDGGGSGEAPSKRVPKLQFS
jgi:hypothetical protein